MPAEKALSIFGQGEVWNPNLKEVVELAEIEPDTMIRIIRRGSVRLLSEDKVCIYHNLENARVYQGSEFKCIEIDDEVSDDNSGGGCSMCDVLFMYSCFFPDRRLILWSACLRLIQHLSRWMNCLCHHSNNR